MRHSAASRSPGRCTTPVMVLSLFLTAACSSTGSPDATLYPDNGPVSFQGAEIASLSGFPGAAGSRVIYGGSTVSNTSSRPAEGVAGRLIGDVDPRDAEVVEVGLVDLGPLPGAGDLFGAGPRQSRLFQRIWSKATPVEAAEIPAGHTANVIYVIKVHHEGHWYWPEAALDYQVDGTTYTASAVRGFVVCPPKSDDCSA